MHYNELQANNKLVQQGENGDPVNPSLAYGLPKRRNSIATKRVPRRERLLIVLMIFKAAPLTPVLHMMPIIIAKIPLKLDSIGLNTIMYDFASEVKMEPNTPPGKSAVYGATVFIR